MTSYSAFADAYFTARRPRAAAAPATRQKTVESLAFTHALVALAAQLSAIDGTPKKSEYLAFQNLFVAQGEADEAKLRSLFVKHVGERSSLLQYARQVAALTGNQMSLRQDIFVRYVRIATADGSLNAAEMEWLRAVGNAFELDRDFVRTQLEQCFTVAQSPYAILEVSPSVSDEQLRQAYMARVQTLHPDRYQAAGASAETVAMLSQQLAVVNAAYDSAMKARQKKSAFSPTRLWGAKRERSAKASAA